MSRAVVGALSCDKASRHPYHTWRYNGELVACDGQPAEVRGQCCTDPLCPCAYKPGWGAYAAPGRPRRYTDDYDD